MIRPKRLKRPKMGVREPERRIFQVHRAFVRRHACSVPGCDRKPIEFAHVKTRGSGGHDKDGVSLCLEHHREQHSIGIETFQRRHGIDLWAVAAAFVRATPDKALREHLREAAP
jgi:hypothetical protein